MDEVEIGESLDELIVASLQEAQSASEPSDKLHHLKRTEELLLNRESGAHLIDNFLDEMLQFAAHPQSSIKCFVISFIERACKKDAEVMRKAVNTLTFLLMADGDSNVQVTKKAMSACTNIYSIVLRWVVSTRGDQDVKSCWDSFCQLKARIMFHIDNDNEGIRTMVIKFLEAVVLAQSTKTDQSENGSKDQMSFNEIPRDHRYISYRQMQSEAQHCMQSLIDQTTISHISSQNLLTVLAALCNISRQRPDFFSRVVDAIDVLQVNLPPTLSTSQVKAVRKELKMHLLRLMKHPSAIPYAIKISTLLSDLGATQLEIQKVMPVEAKRKASTVKEEEPLEKRKKDEAGPSNAGEEDEEDDEEDLKTDLTMESAIDVTERFVFSRLNPTIVTNLVLISLATLPDTMPAAFQATHTPIASAGTEFQRRRLSRMIATQATSIGIGPGADQLKEQKLKAIQERHIARNEGAVIPPTPAHFMKTEEGTSTKRLPPKVQVSLPPPVAVSKTKVQMNIVTSCKDMTKEERERLFVITLNRLMDCEKRAQQGGAAQAQHKILVRLVSRFKENNDHLEKMLTDFIIKEHKSRSELALLWVAEMHAQYHGFSLCYSSSHEDGKMTKEERLARYDKVLVRLLENLLMNELHKETIFHKIFLEAPLITPGALSYLKQACIDPIFGAFAITTLRELVLTRSRQREELLQLLFHLTFYEKHETRSQSIETIKELFELPYMRACVRECVVRQLEECTLDTPPPHFIIDSQNTQWTTLHRAALALPVATLTLDHSLIHDMARVFVMSSSKDFKLTMMRSIESAVKVMGQNSIEILRLLDEAPDGTESFIARIVHLLTERAPATPEIVVRMKRLHDKRNLDVRSLLPILSGLDKTDLLIILPKFLLTALHAKQFGFAVKKILSTKNAETGEYAMTPSELLTEYHRFIPKTSEQKRLLRENVRTPLTAYRSMTKEYISSSIEDMLRDSPIPPLLFHTIVTVYELHTSLHAFLSNVLHKIVNRNLWKDNEESQNDFFQAIVAMPDISYPVALTNLSLEDLTKLIGSTQNVNISEKLAKALPTLSSHQQRSISNEVLELIGVSDRPCDIRDKEREKERMEREERRERDRDRDGRDRRRDERRNERSIDDRRSTRRSYAIGDK